MFFRGVLNKVKEIFSDKKKAVYYAALLFVMLFGAFLRINAYLMNSSMWYDEVSLALNVRENVFLPPLLNNQSAPFLFLILAKICSIFSHSNFSYRFIPLVSGLISIPVFYIFAKNFIKSKPGLLLALFIFCINFRLIYFSREFKPYAVDVLVFMLAAICFFRLFAAHENGFSKLTKLKSAFFGAGFALLPLLSFPSLFVLPVCFFAALLKIKEDYKKVLAFLAPFFVLIPVYYFLFLANYSGNEYFQRFWHDGFAAPSTVFPLIIKMFDYFMEPLPVNIFFLVSLVLGLALCFRQNLKKTLFLTAAFSFVLLASFLHKYPLQDRLILFLFPAFLVFVLKIFDMKAKKVWISILLFLLSFGFYIKTDVAKVFDSEAYCRESVTGLLNILKAEYKEGEYILPLPWSDVAFEHYNMVYGFPKENIIKSEINHPINYTKPFHNVKKGKYWLIFTIQSDNYTRYVDLQKWLERDFKVIKIYKDHSSRMYYAEKIR